MKFTSLLISCVCILLVFIANAEANSATTFEFLNGKITINESIGIYKDFTIHILNNGNAHYISNVTITHHSKELWAEVSQDGEFVEKKIVGTTCTDIGGIEYIHPISLNYDKTKGYRYTCSEEVIYENFTEDGVLHLVISDDNFGCGKSVYLSIEYEIEDFLKYDDYLSLFYIEHLEGIAIPQDAIYKYVKYNSKIIFPYSRNPKRGNEYMPFIMFPLGYTTYDRDMNVTIIQDDPLILNLAKDIKNSDKPLLLLMFFDKLEKPKLFVG